MEVYGCEPPKIGSIQRCPITIANEGFFVKITPLLTEGGLLNIDPFDPWAHYP